MSSKFKQTKMKIRANFFVGLTLFLTLLLVNTSANAQQSDCDRACLEGFVDLYLQALIANDASRLPLSSDIRFTENTIQLNLTQGLWHSASKLGDFKIYISDPATGQAGYHGVVFENDEPRLLSARLSMKNGEIREIETLVARAGMAPIDPPPSIVTRAVPSTFAEPLSNNEKVSRLEMIAAANQYFEGIEQNSGDIVPFDDECNRFENGLQTTNISFVPGGPALGCKEQFNAGGMFWTMPERRFMLVDEERGLVMVNVVFRSELPEQGSEEGIPGLGPKLAHNALIELFKIKNGRIYDIDAILGPMLPYGQKTGW